MLLLSHLWKLEEKQGRAIEPGLSIRVLVEPLDDSEVRWVLRVSSAADEGLLAREGGVHLVGQCPASETVPVDG